MPAWPERLTRHGLSPPRRERAVSRRLNAKRAHSRHWDSHDRGDPIWRLCALSSCYNSLIFSVKPFFFSVHLVLLSTFRAEHSSPLGLDDLPPVLIDEYPVFHDSYPPVAPTAFHLLPLYGLSPPPGELPSAAPRTSRPASWLKVLSASLACFCLSLGRGRFTKRMYWGFPGSH